MNHLAHQTQQQRLLPLLLGGTAPRLVVRWGKRRGCGDLAGLRQGPGAAMVDGGPFDLGILQGERLAKQHRQPHGAGQGAVGQQDHVGRSR